MKPFTIQAVERKTGETVAVAKISADGSATTQLHGEVVHGLRGPFENIVFHVGHKLLKTFGDEDLSLRAAKETGAITDGDIAANLPQGYQGYDFIRSN